jgi:hypothetical protein
MTQLQKKAILYILDQSRSPSIPAAEYDMQDGKLVRTEFVDGKEVERLFDSEDFRKGWDLCYNKMSEYLKFVATASPVELRKFLR